MPVTEHPPEAMHQTLTCQLTATEADRILIIDDEDAIVSALSSQLRQQGFRVSLAGTGSQGRTAAHRDRPNLIILDLRLPDIDGFSLCQELADAPATASTPVILLSGMVRPDIIRRSRAAGCQYFVRKPYDPGALLVLIRHSLDDSRRWSAPAENE
ncbi:MAG TPA: response regulator [Pirellulales bacterium]|jgi:DNA-binding response OmpR family regulator